MILTKLFCGVRNWLRIEVFIAKLFLPYFCVSFLTPYSSSVFIYLSLFDYNTPPHFSIPFYTPFLSSSIISTSLHTNHPLPCPFPVVLHGFHILFNIIQVFSIQDLYNSFSVHFFPPYWFHIHSFIYSFHILQFFFHPLYWFHIPYFQSSSSINSPWSFLFR